MAMFRILNQFWHELYRCERGYHVFYFLITHVVDLHESCQLSDNIFGGIKTTRWQMFYSHFHRLPFLLPWQGQGWIHRWRGGDADHGRSLWHPWLQVVGSLFRESSSAIEITCKSPGMKRLMSTVSLLAAWFSPSLNSRYRSIECKKRLSPSWQI